MSKILVVGQGARESALVWKLSQSPNISKIYVALGNASTASLAKNIPIKMDDIESLHIFARKNSIDVTVVGSDETLALGIVDVFRGTGLRIFGPTRQAAKIESSKIFAKGLMKDAGIKTADFHVFHGWSKASSYIETCKMPVVIKASGLTGGKGVYVCKTISQAKEALKLIMVDRVFGDAGNIVIVEEFLGGREISVHALCDGNTFLLFRHHKTTKLFMMVAKASILVAWELFVLCQE